MLSKLISLGLSFELAAIGLLFLHSHSLALMASFLLLHAAACVVLAFGLLLTLPTQYRQPRQWVLLYLFSFNFFVPMVGLLCLALGQVLGMWLPRLIQKNRFEVAGNPQFTTHRNNEGTGFRGGQVRAQLGNIGAPLDQRLKALLAVQDTPARATGSLLRTLLSDPSDDMRLLAYGILDTKEKAITSRILDNRHLLEAVPDDAERFRLNKLIAELYWELVYQDLVQGDMRAFSAEQVRKYATAALSLRDADAGLWFLLVRLELFSQRIAAAEMALAKAREADFARERLLPYLAELRFLQRRFDDVQQLFEEMADRAGVPALAQSRRYWLAGGGRERFSQALYRQDECNDAVTRDVHLAKAAPV